MFTSMFKNGELFQTVFLSNFLKIFSLYTKLLVLYSSIILSMYVLAAIG
jgi:hypothetical protein